MRLSPTARKISLAAALVLAGVVLWWYRARSVPYPFDDLRQSMLDRQVRSLSGLDLRDHADVLRTATFDTRTRWPPASRMPAGFDPHRLLEVGRDPGLGVRQLHAEGITGKGVRVAIIDQPLLPDHREYAGKIETYTTIDCADAQPSMHGPAVASLLVGERCGTAPGASLLYWAEPSWKRDYAQRTEALRQILAFNAGKPLAQRVRVVSVSIGVDERLANVQGWKETLSEAESRDVVVVHCGARIAGLRCAIESDREVSANYTNCYYAQRAAWRLRKGTIGVPIDHRTTASYEGRDDYIFWAEGGLSWGAPYLAGVIALGLQVNPTLDPAAVWRLLNETGEPLDDGVVVHPRRFVERARAAAPSSNGGDGP